MSTAATPSVSTVIPSYNCAKYLPDAIDSLLAQSLPPEEIIVVDDGSIDDTPDVIRGYSDRVTYIRQDNGGDAAARNRGIEIATGDYIAVSDADDICARDRIEHQVAALRADPEAIACFTGHWIFDERGLITSHSPSPAVGRQDSLDHIGRCLVHPPTLMFDRRKSRGLLYPTGFVHADMCFVSLLRTRGRFVVLPELLYGYRRRSGQLTQEFSFLVGFQNRLRWLNAHWKEYWGEKTFPQIEQAVWWGLVETMVAFYWSRDRARFIQCRDYLGDHWPSTLVRPGECDWHWYPDWLWGARELVSRQLSRMRS